MVVVCTLSLMAGSKAMQIVTALCKGLYCLRHGQLQKELDISPLQDSKVELHPLARAQFALTSRNQLGDKEEVSCLFVQGCRQGWGVFPLTVQLHSKREQGYIPSK